MVTTAENLAGSNAIGSAAASIGDGVTLGTPAQTGGTQKTAKSSNGKGTPASNKTQLNKEDRKLQREQRMARKLELAAQNDTSIVSRTTLDTNTMVYLLNWNDRLMSRMRELIGHRPTLTLEIFASMLEKSRDIKQQFDDFNKELAVTVGENKYESPRELKQNS